MTVTTPGDYRDDARRRLPRFLFDYADGGSYAEETMRRNISDLSDVNLRQRVLRNVDEIDLSATLFGVRQSLPIILGPVGIAGMYRRRGEVSAARAAARHGIPFCLSTVSLCSLSEVAAQATVRLWFQLYVIRDRSVMRDLLATAAEQGAKALVFTVDMPVPGARYRDAKSGMSGPYAPFRRILQAAGKPAWAWDVGVRGRPHALGNLTPHIGSSSDLNDYMGWLGANFDASITWSDLEWIRSAWSGPLIIKGILDPDDARAAIETGADAVIVSNHGGRQLDGAVSTVRALPAVVEATQNRVPVLVDGGIRSGLDVVKMLSLGADSVLLGRLWLYALASGGENGVYDLLDMLSREVRVAMALSGARTMADTRAAQAHKP